MIQNMLAKLYSGAIVGLEGELVEVEVSIASGLPAFHIVGLPDSMITESKERVRAAVANSGAPAVPSPEAPRRPDAHGTHA